MSWLCFSSWGKSLGMWGKKFKSGEKSENFIGSKWEQSISYILYLIYFVSNSNEHIHWMIDKGDFSVCKLTSLMTMELHLGKISTGKLCVNEMLVGNPGRIHHPSVPIDFEESHFDFWFFVSLLLLALNICIWNNLDDIRNFSCYRKHVIASFHPNIYKNI